MRLKWFLRLRPSVQVLVLTGVIFIFLIFYLCLSKYLKPTTVSLLSLPLKFSEELSFNAKQLLTYQNLVKENKRLRSEIGRVTGQLVQLQETALENERLRGLLSLPQSKSFTTVTCLIIGKDSSNWTKTLLINRGTKSGVKAGMPVILETGLVGRVLETSGSSAKVGLITDFNSKIPAKILRSREEGVVFGTLTAGQSVCKIKYIQKIKAGDQVVSSGLGQVYPKGLLIGKVVVIEEEKDQLYKVAQVAPAVDFSTLEEVMVITKQ